MLPRSPTIGVALVALVAVVSTAACSSSDNARPDASPLSAECAVAAQARPPDYDRLEFFGLLTLGLAINYPLPASFEA